MSHLASVIDEGKLPTSMTVKNGKCTESTRKLPNSITHSEGRIWTFDELCDSLEKEFEFEQPTPSELLFLEFVKKHWIVENGISKCEW